MSINTLLLFFLTVFPLIITPGPDILFIASRGLSKGLRSAMQAVGGVLLGYSMHAMLSALGIAALVSASPKLFTAIKWIGVAYLVFLALRLIISGFQKKEEMNWEDNKVEKKSLLHGFFTSFLNPKGLLVYLSILPQFISPEGKTAAQALSFSALFIFSCGIVYPTCQVKCHMTPEFL